MGGHPVYYAPLWLFEKQLKRLGFYVILPTVILPENDNVKKGLTFLFLNIGILIFASVIFVKIDVMSHKIHSDVQLFSADLDWEGFLYHQAVQNIAKER